jgi:hypothetical protein
MWWWRKIRKANIPDELRDRFELFGQDVMAHAIGAGEHSSKGVELDGLLRQNRAEILEWLREKRDEAAQHADRLETVEWAILIFVVIGVAADLAIVAHEIGWLHPN